MAGTPQPRRQAVWPTVGVALGIVLIGVVIGLAIDVLMDGMGGTSASDGSSQAPQLTSAARCDSAMPLHIATDAAVVPIVERLAQRYARQMAADGHGCVDIRVRQVASAAVVGRLTNGWDPRTHGPRPHVWIPQSTVWVELLRTQLDDSSLVESKPTVIARSPTVMAMPRAMAEAVGWPQQRLSWTQLAAMADSDQGWAAHDHPEWGSFRVWLTDPRYTTLGLQALLALDASQGDDGSQASSAEQAATPLSLFRVQRLLTSIDASTQAQLERYVASEDPLQAVSAFPIEEWRLWQFNQGLTAVPSEGAGQSGDTPPHEDRPLAAVYPTGNDQIAMESDYPYVALDAPWAKPDVMQHADGFGDFLLSDPAQQLFADAGFRGPDNAPTDELDMGANAQTMSAGTAAGTLPDVEGLAALRSSWVNVPRLSTTLFVVDVSGSMAEQVPGTGQTRLQATIDAAQEALQIIPPASDVGLWEFSTDLEDGSNDGDYRELVPTGPLNEADNKQQLIAALGALDPENDTALNDTLLAGYRAMQSIYTSGQQHTILLLTDGRNDDENSISHDQLIAELQRLRNPEEPIEVVSIAYGEQPDLDLLTQISEEVGGQVIASPDLADLDRLMVEALSR
jgi:Ca-activated chloride channel family protein